MQHVLWCNKAGATNNDDHKKKLKLVGSDYDDGGNGVAINRDHICVSIHTTWHTNHSANLLYYMFGFALKIDARIEQLRHTQCMAIYQFMNFYLCELNRTEAIKQNRQANRQHIYNGRSTWIGYIANKHKHFGDIYAYIFI